MTWWLRDVRVARGLILAVSVGHVSGRKQNKKFLWSVESSSEAQRLVVEQEAAGDNDDVSTVSIRHTWASTLFCRTRNDVKISHTASQSFSVIALL